MLALAFESKAQNRNSEKTMNWVENVDGEKREASARMVDGEWVFEGDEALVEKMKERMANQDGEGMVFFHSDGDEDGEVIIKKIQVDEENGNPRIEIISDEEGGENVEVIINGSGAESDANVFIYNSHDEEGDHHPHVWVSSVSGGGDETRALVISEGKVYESVDPEVIEKIQAMSEEGKSGDQIVEELNLEKSESQMVIDIEKEVSVEVDGDGEREIVVIVKNVVVEDIEDSEIPKNLRRGVEITDEDVFGDLGFYPNPSSGLFSVKGVSSSTQDIEIKVTDMNGRQVHKSTLIPSEGPFEERIDLRDQGEGVYLVRILQNEQAVIKKVVIQ